LGSTEFGEKVEVKNMNRARAVREAVEHEIERQIAAIGRGERIVQETRGWMDGEKLTVTQRSKEDAHDYRYFPEPDIPPLHISRDWVSEIAEEEKAQTQTGGKPVRSRRRGRRSRGKGEPTR